jgi:hypothetical protein
MCVFEPGTQVVEKRTSRYIGRVERMDDTKPGEPRRVVVAGVSRLANSVAPLVGPWDKGDK